MPGATPDVQLFALTEFAWSVQFCWLGDGEKCLAQAIC